MTLSTSVSGMLGGGDEGGRIGVVRVAGLRRRFVIMDFGRKAESGRRRRGQRDQAAREGDGADAARDGPRAVEHDQVQLRWVAARSRMTFVMLSAMRGTSASVAICASTGSR